MKTTVIKKPTPSLIFIFLCLALPSAYSLIKFFSLWQILAYMLALVLSLFLLTAQTTQNIFDTKDNRKVNLKSLFFLFLPVITLIGLFILLYPIANNRELFLGSDDEDCINGALQLIFSGNNPYDYRSYLGNSLNVLPGTLFISAPFSLLGNSAYQNIFWVLVYGIFLLFWTEKHRAAHIVFWLMCSSPGLVHQVVTGTEHISNSIYVMLGTVAYYYALTRQRSLAIKILTSLFLGLVMSGRINYLLILPIIIFYTVHDKVTNNFINLAWLLPAAFIFVLLVMLYPSALLVPLRGVLNRVNSFQTHFPGFTFISTLGGFIGAIFANNILKLQCKDSRFFLSCGIVVITPFLITSIIELSRNTPIPFTHSSYFYSGILFFIPTLLKSISNFQKKID